MRRILFPLLFLGLVAGCSVPRIGPHRIDVQQGNALDQENVARLKIGLNRAQVRFLLGTPLVVDPFRTDRWDYVYLYYKSGQLTEQKRITLFFEGDTLARIEGDLPAVPPASEISASGVAESARTANTQVASAQAGALPAAATGKPVPAADKPVARETVFAESAAVRPAVPQPAGAPPPAVGPTAQSAATIVAPLPSPPNAPAYVDPRVKPEPPPGMIVETDVERIRPDVIPPFPDTQPAGLDDDAVLQAVDAWAKAWAARNESAYLAAYDAEFVPVGYSSRGDWEKRRKLLLGMSTNIDLRIDSPSVERNDDGSATVTFNQFYRSDSYRDAVVKQLKLVSRDGRWLIVQEKVLSILRGARP
ncbi:MAG: outer membrane protein assembly factor BamE [Thiobacillus sp.]|nr:outer membrane protein assembly factor BamE [Thiobacillus sp.]